MFVIEMNHILYLSIRSYFRERNIMINIYIYMFTGVAKYDRPRVQCSDNIDRSNDIHTGRKTCC